ncbi:MULTISPECIES: four helix bundle protein [unclassified Mesotoga]|uniref:four helix bundle protein n=1 Tax=unclassified Mesotoga TaxID=1184398 RepID=UPI000DB3F93A|nr:MULTISPECIES: four helix bundle protein [unclassified Mesotoga]PZC52376.1 hypothetical protein LH53_05185 [Mesotoga sp. TolDC]
MRSYKELDAWKFSMELAKKIYEITEDFPARETYGLSSQMQRAAVSVPSNIAEGSGRNSRKEFVHFIYHSRGALLELETQLELSRMLGYLHEEKYGETAKLITRIHKIINGLIFSLKNSPTTNNPQPTTSEG